MGSESQGRQDLKPIVSDTGPLLHLREAGALNLLETAGRIVSPPAVQAELIDHDSFWEERRPVWVQVERLEPMFSERAARWLQAGLLDPGETEALSLALQLEAAWFLTDDAAARLIEATRARGPRLPWRGPLGRCNGSPPASGCGEDLGSPRRLLAMDFLPSPGGRAGSTATDLHGRGA